MRKKVIGTISALAGAALLGYHLYGEQFVQKANAPVDTSARISTRANPTSFSERKLPTESMLSETQKQEAELKKILAIRHARNENEIQVAITKSSGDMLYGFVGLGCKEGVSYEENLGCSGLFYANKLTDGWHIIDGNGFSCADVLNIGFSKDFDNFTANCTQ